MGLWFVLYVHYRLHHALIYQETMFKFLYDDINNYFISLTLWYACMHIELLNMTPFGILQTISHVMHIQNKFISLVCKDCLMR